MKELFSDVLSEYVKDRGWTPGRLSEQTGVSGKTIASWLEGRVKRPRNPYDIVLLGAAIRLNDDELIRLLQAANQRTPLRQLLNSPALLANPHYQELAAHWPVAIASSADVSARNVSAYIPSPGFVGRLKQRKRLRTILLQGGQICVLEGMGGVGKSALADEIFEELRHAFPDGSFRVDLSQAVIDGVVDLAAIQSILGLLFEQMGVADLADKVEAKERGEYLRQHIKTKRLLLLLDNVHGPKDFAFFLPDYPFQYSILITTRAGKLLDSYAKDLKPKEVTQYIEVTPFNEEEGIEFVAKNLNIPFGAIDRVAAGRIWKILDGLALAMGIALSSVGGLAQITLGELADELELEMFETLNEVGHERNIMQRSLDRSYKRLEENMQELLAQLSLFGGRTLRGIGFDVLAAAALTGIRPGMLKLKLERLANLFLVSIHEPAADESETHQTRYRLHSIVRAYAAEKLVEMPDRDEALITNVYKHYVTQAWEHRLDSGLHEQDLLHLLGALEWVCQTRHWDLLPTGIDAVTYINFGLIGHLDRAGHWKKATSLLTHLQSQMQTRNDQFAKALVLLKLGAFALRYSDIEEATKKLNDSEAIFATLSLDDDSAIGFAYLCDLMAQLKVSEDTAAALVWSQKGIDRLQAVATEVARHEKGYLFIRHSSTLGRSGQFDEVIRYCQEGLSLLPDRPTAAHISAWMNLGNVYAFQGDNRQAMTQWMAAQTAAGALGDRRRQAGILQNMAIASSWADDFRQSIKYNEQARQIFVQLEDVEGECNVGANLGLDYLWLARDKEARRVLEEVSVKSQKHKLGHVEVFARANLARVLVFAGELDIANECLTRALALAVQLDIRPEYAEILRLQADVALQNGSLEVAEAKAKAAVSEATAVNERQHGCALRTLANVCWSLGQTEFARSCYQESLALLFNESRFEHARTQMALGCRILSTDSEQAVELLRPALEVFRAVGASRELAQAKACLQKN